VLTLTEAADQLGLAASTLRHQVQAGRLGATLIGKTYVITERELARYRAESLGKPGRPSHRAAPRPGR
jgi:excisionase family DNA binding protein